ncbi:MAG TPA: hypothetical protein DCM54_13345 [Gammaproteobacteria bacterium]|nr:hypothetical protein [Gammaproteobacteria bacterium]
MFGFDHPFESTILAEVFKFLGRPQENSSARIIVDGCAGYFVELSTPAVTRMLSRKGRPLRYRSLSDARACAHRHGAQTIVFEHRVADDEACAGKSPGFTQLPC